MMKMSGRVTSSCVALIFVLNSVSAVQRLRSIDDLEEIDFGQSVPKHSLLLLHWFANTIYIDDNNVMWLTFDPNIGDYGSHQYHNSEGLLESLPWGNEYQYYTVGNIYQETSMPLPQYVVRPRRGYNGRNRDRIIVRIRGQNTGRAWQRIDHVYITQHIEHQGTPYDPDHTYRINMNLLRQIGEFSMGLNHQQLVQLRNRYESSADNSQLRRIRNTWGGLAGLGLLLFIVIQERFTSNQRNEDDDSSESESNVPRYQRNRSDVRVDVRDHGASRTTGNTSATQNKDNRSFCSRCFTAICLILLYIIVVSLLNKRG